MGFATNENLLNAVSNAGLDYDVLGHAAFDEPIVAIDAGGSADPGVVIAAGAHATEHAGVAAAVELSQTLDTDQAVSIVPTRDPVGLNGYEWALQNVLDRNIDLQSFPDLEALLRTEGEAIYENDGMVLALIDDLGFASARPGRNGESAQLHLLKRIKGLQHGSPDSLEAYKGRQILLPAGQPDVPGNGAFDRAYSMVISPSGEALHFNRFFDRDWAPLSTRAVRNLVQTVDPGLVYDLHETQLAEDRVFLTMNRHQDVSRNKLQDAVARETIEGAVKSGAETARDSDIEAMAYITKSNPDAEISDPLYEPLADGIYVKTDPDRRGEGENLVDYGAGTGRLAMTLETGMLAPEATRAAWHVNAVRNGVAAFDELV